MILISLEEEHIGTVIVNAVLKIILFLENIYEMGGQNLVDAIFAYLVEKKKLKKY
jgi:uncharacterized protein YqhQ